MKLSENRGAEREPSDGRERMHGAITAARNEPQTHESLERDVSITSLRAGQRHVLSPMMLVLCDAKDRKPDDLLMGKGCVGIRAQTVRQVRREQESEVPLGPLLRQVEIRRIAIEIGERDALGSQLRLQACRLRKLRQEMAALAVAVGPLFRIQLIVIQ